MKFFGAVIIVLALLVGVVSQFSDCSSQGKGIPLPNGKVLPMKCHWTARSEMVLAAPLLLTGIFLTYPCGGRRQSAIMSILLGVLIILLPTSLVGVCAREDMVCAAVMKPTLVLAGVLAIAVGAFCALKDRRGRGKE